MKKLAIVTVACFMSVVTWGRSFSIDLRQPVENTGVRAKAKVKAAPATENGAGMLRKVDLAAGVADVGSVAVGDELTFALFDDVIVTLTLKKHMPSPLSGDVFLAEASGYDGVKNAVVLRTEDGLTIDIQDYLNKKVYKVISTATGVLVQEMEAKGGKCGCDALEPPKSAEISSANVRKARKIVAAKGSETDETCVDILVAYDKNAATWADSNGGGITNFAEMAVQKMNTALANNGLDSYFRFRLVGVVRVAASSDNLDFALEAATYGKEGWASIKAARNEVAADIVTVLIDTGTEDGSTGLGWSLESSNFATFSENAYNCCAIRSVEQSHTMTHEVGHNMGCGHSDVQATDPGPQLYPYSAGYYFTAEGEKYHTVMAYDCEGPGGIEVPYFSSPDFAYRGTTVGNETHDNTRTLINTFRTAIAWRGGATEYEWKVEPSKDGPGCVIVSVSPSPSGALEIPATVRGQPVVGLGEGLFQYCNGLISVKIPDGVKTIGDQAFFECEELVDVNIPSSVTYIGWSAFGECASLKTVSVPDGVDDLTGVFYGCGSLTRIDVSSTNPYFSTVNGLLCNKTVTTLVACPGGLADVTIPSSIRFIDDLAFYGCHNLKHLILPDGLSYISWSAFCNCTSLEDIRIPDGVTSIGQTAFYGCASLSDVTIPDSVSYIGSGVFSGCSNLTHLVVADGNLYYSVTGNLLCDKAQTTVVSCFGSSDHVVVPDGVKVIGQSAFSGCMNLESVVLPESLVIVGGDAFNDCSGLKSIVIPDSVTEIGLQAFCDCSSLQDVQIGNGVTNIATLAFGWCDNLTNITFGANVESIGTYAFEGCGHLISITIPASVKYLGRDLFFPCGTSLRLKEVHFLGRPPVMDEGSNEEYYRSLRIKGTYQSAFKTEWESALDASGYWHWLEMLPRDEVVRICFDANGGEDSSVALCRRGDVVVFPTVSRDGYVFSGWWTEPNGGDSVSEGTLASADITYYAHWTVGFATLAYSSPWAARDAALAEGKILFVLSGADWCPWTRVVKDYLDSLGNAFWDKFVVYYCNVDTDTYGMSDGVPSYGAFNPKKFNCNWREGRLSYNSGGVAERVQAVIDAALANYNPDATEPTEPDPTFDPTPGQESAEFADLAYSSPWAARDAALAGGKLLFVLSGADWCPWTQIVKDYLESQGDAFWGKFAVYYCNVDTDTYGMSDGVPSYGAFNPKEFNGNWYDGILAYDIGGVESRVQAVINEALRKSAADVPPSDSNPKPDPVKPSPTDGGAKEGSMGLNTAFSKAQTVVGALYSGDVLAGIVELKFGKMNAKKGSVKVSGTATLMDGGKSKKVVAKAVNMSLAGGAMSGTLAFKAPVGSMSFALSSDGSLALKNSSYEMVEADVGGTLSSGRHTFSLGEISFASGGELQEQLLPTDETFNVSGVRWTFGKNASVKLARNRSTNEYDLQVDTSNGRTNLSSMKLTYTSKTGLFKGSFKVYALTVSNGRTKLAKYTANVIGFVVDGVGYGQATIKRPATGPWSVTIQ